MARSPSDRIGKQAVCGWGDTNAWNLGILDRRILLAIGSESDTENRILLRRRPDENLQRFSEKPAWVFARFNCIAAIIVGVKCVSIQSFFGGMNKEVRIPIHLAHNYVRHINFSGVYEHA